MSGFPAVSVVKNLPANAGDTEDVGSLLGQKDPLEEEMTTYSQYSCLENAMDRGAWRATVHGAAESNMTARTSVKNLIDN